ncbi:lipopolysaccharide assembly protein LapB [Erythrobacter sp. JK5]|uniref:tetratricopeptide repeat protein n=1 Tax=Erythrobacter sp. JK5 TaxID=2829500 RepID=UPI001BA6808D|nr:tetratricopeptide repeat protein [Erythrobacter sp. JK5]QUL38857.1 tetratricopeptide repeat protein [Erythrobacter sp. JK5]
MPDRGRSFFTVALAAALLCGCSGGGERSSASDLSGSAEFVRLVEDARFEMREGRLDDAGVLLDQARTIEPDNPGLWVTIARLRFSGGEHLTALEAADYALELGPDYAPALLLRAQLVRDAHGLADAIPWFESAVAADPANVELLVDYAATLGDLGRYRDMLAIVRRAAEIDRTYPGIYYLQAVLAARAGDPVLARSLLERSGMSGRGGVPAAILLDALTDLQQANNDKAAETLDALHERQPGNIRVLELLAQALWFSGRDQELVERFGARALSPDASPYLTMLVGRAHERLGDRAAAAPLFERASGAYQVRLTVLGSTPFGRAELPQSTAELRDLVSAGDLAGAGRVADDLLQRFPLSSDAHALAGDIAFAGGDPETALERYRVAAAIRRPWPLTRKIIAAYRAYGDDTAADTLLARHVVGEPNNAEALLMLAERSAQADDWLRVAVLLDHAIALGAGNDPKLIALRADAAAALGREDEARGFDARLRELRPGNFVAG